MRTGRLLATACFVVLAAAACGSPAGPASAGSGNTLRTTDSSAPATTTAPTSVTTTGRHVPPPIAPAPTAVPVPTLPRSPVPPGQISAPGMTVPPQGVEVTDNGLDVVFTAEQAGCRLITAQVQGQTATTVTIQVVTTNTSRGNMVCPMIVRDVQVAAQLSSPLGSRKLVFTAITKHS